MEFTKWTHIFRCIILLLHTIASMKDLYQTNQRDPEIQDTREFLAKISLKPYYGDTWAMVYKGTVSSHTD